jgi:tetratricopeptide (TPR) repeat protein|tara:strand:+ start:336 stop:887 length:552 start_codon:yes stop_codon:yes gene_type:complete
MRYFSSILMILLLFNISNIKADEKNKQLDRLFNDLKFKDASLSYEIEKKIWKLWSTHPNNDKLTVMLAKGSNLVNNNKLNEAIDVFSNVIDLDPNWAEAWNKRATVLYMVGKFKKSQEDIDKVLEIEERHFGALAGQGLVNIQLENYEKAIISYKKAQQIYPSMQSPKIMIKQIEELIKRESI